jgi:hypothetical protein
MSETIEETPTERRSLIARLLPIRRKLATAEDVSGRAVEVRAASVGSITARRASMTRSVAREIHAGEDVTMALSAAARVDAGGDAMITGGAAGALFASGGAHLDGSTAGVLIASSAQVESGNIGLLIARDARLGSSARVLISAREALILGAAIGIFYPLVRYLLSRFAPAPPSDDAPPKPWYMQLAMWLGALALRLGVTALLIWIGYRALRRRIERLLPFLAR